MEKSRHLAKPDYVARREAREAARIAARRKKQTAAAAVALVSVLAVGGTVAWMTDKTPAVENTFTPASVPVSVVEEFDGETKEDVRIQNEGNVRAYIRAYATVNWVDADGNVVANVPDGYSYEPIDPFVDATGWALGADGFYYYLTPVEPNDGNQATTDDMTGILIESITQSKTGEDYSLQVDIIAQSIQADGVSVDDTPAVVDAWSSGVSSVDAKTGELAIKTTQGA